MLSYRGICITDENTHHYTNLPQNWHVMSDASRQAWLLSIAREPRLAALQKKQPKLFDSSALSDS